MTAAIQARLRRGTAAQVLAMTPAQGEAVVDTDHNRICVGVGASAGGWPLARIADGPFAVITWPPYNAVPGGVVDNTAAYAAAVADLQATGQGGTIITPPGIFYCAGGVNDGANSSANAAIKFVGAGMGSDHGNGTYVFSTGSCITVGTNDVSAVTLKNLWSSVEDMNIEGCNSLTTTTPSINIASTASDVSITHSRVKFGYSCIAGTGQQTILRDVRAAFCYGPEIINLPAGPLIDCCQFDQTSKTLGMKWPGVFGTVVLPWAAGQPAVAATTIVSIGGFWFMCFVGGTTGSVTPTPLPYGQAVSDGAVQWKLFRPAAYNCIASSSLTMRACDITGPFDAGLYLTAAANLDVTCNNFETWKYAIWGHDGGDAFIAGNNLGQDVDTNGAGILFDTGWLGGDKIAHNNVNAVNGIISNGAGGGSVYEGNTIHCVGKSGTTTGISIAGGVSAITIKNNPIGMFFGDPTFTNGIVIGAGAGSNLCVDDNTVNAATPITNGATGTGNRIQTGATPTTPVLLAQAVSSSLSRTSSAQVSPTGTSNLSGAGRVMMGMNYTFTPKATGNFFFTMAGTGQNTVAGDGFIARLRYGTGTPPVNGAAETGTVVTGSSAQGDVVGAGGSEDCASCATATGLTVGTTYWLDIALCARTGGTASLSGMVLSAIEI